MSKNESGALSAVSMSSTTMIRLGRYLLCQSNPMKRNDLRDLGLDRVKTAAFLSS